MWKQLIVRWNRLFLHYKKKHQHDFCLCVFEDLSSVQKKDVLPPPADSPPSWWREEISKLAAGMSTLLALRSLSVLLWPSSPPCWSPLRDSSEMRWYRNTQLAASGDDILLLSFQSPASFHLLFPHREQTLSSSSGYEHLVVSGRLKNERHAPVRAAVLCCGRSNKVASRGFTRGDVTQDSWLTSSFHTKPPPRWLLRAGMLGIHDGAAKKYN